MSVGNSRRGARGRAAALGRTFGALLCLSIALSSGCARRDPPAATDSSARVLRISQRNEPADLDPARATLPDEFFILRALSEGLVNPLPLTSSTGAVAGVAPGVAERWETSADGLIVTFHLRADARWSNGDPVTAEDFLASYRRALQPATAASKAPLFHLVKNARAFASGALTDFAGVGFAAPDPRTFVITLERPEPNFLVYAASGPWLPVHPRTVEQHGRDWTRPENFVGNGPFTLEEWRPNQRIVVRRNPHYHSPQRVRLDEIQFIAFDSGDTEERAYRAGQIDVTMSVPFSKLDVYAAERPAELHRAPLAETRYLSFNTTRPPLDNPRVRRALSLALDREQLVHSVLRGGQQPADTLVSPLLRGRNSSLNRPISFDPAAARQLLAEAGFADGRGFPQLELSAWGVTPQLIEAVQQMWQKELGVRVAITIREARVHLAALREARYDIALVNTIPDVADPADVLKDFLSAAPANYPHWSDARYDALLAAAHASSEPIPRQAQLDAAEARLLDECPLTPLYFNSINWLMSPRVRGWQPDALWTRFYLDVEITPPR
ncbi:peptide ABC transporter substrate-binding protein [Opitutus terrae]|uniref:Extracellular solute-binding protein family 5 n=1 Tax=Opitutus terrae (strain DSM 11246 / JCM 15787 / PB90-1) TaxID=452637 RepID=B1ZSC0_OPITP|nr:peptide ABC transporter substrate-binding protein [Opitutus terrae]ACB75719.1 extracellular solute-binding protein family 5 [Opitutus terrae PB90-1]